MHEQTTPYVAIYLKKKIHSINSRRTDERLEHIEF